MDGKNPKSSPLRAHGLRLIKGAASSAHEPSPGAQSPSAPSPAKKIRNPLLAQLNALADAIDNDVKLILKS